MVRGSPSLDRECLLCLYWSTGGPRWTRQQGWAEGSRDLSKWYGVKVNELGRVVKLDLSRNNLDGTIPAAMGSLEEMSVLRLGGNSLTGPIPAALGNLLELTYLDLRSNQITGSIPADLGKMTEMAKLDLSCNLLSGPIPPELGGMHNLMLLWLEKNHIEGPIPPELANIPHLSDVDLTENRMPEGRLQGQTLQAWRESSRRRGSISTNSQAILEKLLFKDDEIKLLRQENEMLKRENESLSDSRIAPSSRGSGISKGLNGFFKLRK